MADTKDAVVGKFRRQFPECAVADGRLLFDEAYKFLLRRLAMNSGRPIAAVAADLIAFTSVMKGEEP